MEEILITAKEEKTSMPWKKNRTMLLLHFSFVFWMYIVFDCIVYSITK